MRKNRCGVRKKRKWYEKYLPFVARSPEMQVSWLVNVLRKGTLTNQEITPYIRLLLAVEEDEAVQQLGGLLHDLDGPVLRRMVEAAEIYDVPKLIGLIAEPTVEQAVAALRKVPPPYEESPRLVIERVLLAVHARSSGLLEAAAAALRKEGEVPAHFEREYSRFIEILEDEKFLSTLYPKAKFDLTAVGGADPPHHAKTRGGV